MEVKLLAKYIGTSVTVTFGTADFCYFKICMYLRVPNECFICMILKFITHVNDINDVNLTHVFWP